MRQAPSVFLSSGQGNQGSERFDELPVSPSYKGGCLKLILFGFRTWASNAFGAAGDAELKPMWVLPCLGSSDGRENVELSTRMGGSKVGRPRRWWECHTGWAEGKETQDTPL